MFRQDYNISGIEVDSCSHLGDIDQTRYTHVQSTPADVSLILITQDIIPAWNLTVDLEPPWGIPWNILESPWTVLPPKHSANAQILRRLTHLSLYRQGGPSP